MPRFYLKLGIIICTIPSLSQAMSKRIAVNVTKTAPSAADIAGRYAEAKAYSLLGLEPDKQYSRSALNNATQDRENQAFLDYKADKNQQKHAKMWHELQKAYDLVTQINYEKILGVSRNASLAEIEKAYKNYRARKALTDAVEQRGDLRDSYSKEDEAYEHLRYITNVRAERDQDKMKEQARLFDVVNPD